MPTNPLANEQTAQCRGCHRPMIFVTNEKTGKLVPVDPEPVDGGNVVVLASRDQRGALLSRILPRGADHVGPRYVSHFVTCTERNTF